MNLLTLLDHTCDIRRRNVPRVDNSTRDAYNQPRVQETTIFASVPCSYQANVLRSLFLTNVIESAGSLIASVYVNADDVPGIHLGDMVTNVQDRGGHVLEGREWFVFRIIPYADDIGISYYELMLARDEAGPRN